MKGLNMTTTTDSNLAKGVPTTEAYRLVAETAPALVEALERASEEFHQHESGYQDRAAAWQRRAGAIRRRPVSKYAEALDLASAAVTEKFKAMLLAGEVVFAGFRGGDLGGAPEIIPIDLLGGKRPRGGKCTIRGTTFHDLRLYWAETLRGPGRPTGRIRAPKDADDRLRAWLAEVDHADKTIPEVTAELVALHPEILMWWAASTTIKRVGALLPVRCNDFNR